MDRLDKLMKTNISTDAARQEEIQENVILLSQTEVINNPLEFWCPHKFVEEPFNKYGNY